MSSRRTPISCTMSVTPLSKKDSMVAQDNYTYTDHRSASLIPSTRAVLWGGTCYNYILLIIEVRTINDQYNQWLRWSIFYVLLLVSLSIPHLLKPKRTDHLASPFTSVQYLELKNHILIQGAIRTNEKIRPISVAGRATLSGGWAQNSDQIWAQIRMPPPFTVVVPCRLRRISVAKQRQYWLPVLFFVIYHQVTGDEITCKLHPCLGTDSTTHQSDRSCSTTAPTFRWPIISCVAIVKMKRATVNRSDGEMRPPCYHCPERRFRRCVGFLDHPFRRIGSPQLYSSHTANNDE